MSRYQPTNQSLRDPRFAPPSTNQSLRDPRFAPQSMYQFAYPPYLQQQQQAYGGYPQNRGYPAFEGYPQSFGEFKPANNVDPWFNQYGHQSSNVKREAIPPDNSYIEFLKKIKCSWNGKAWMLDGKKIVISSLDNLMRASILEKGNFTEFLKMDETKATLFVKNERAPAAVVQAEVVKDEVIQTEAIIEAKESVKESPKESPKESVKESAEVVLVSESNKKRKVEEEVPKISKSFFKVMPNTLPFDPASSNDLMFQCVYIHNNDGTVHQVGLDYLVKMYKEQYDNKGSLSSS